MMLTTQGKIVAELERALAVAKTGKVRAAAVALVLDTGQADTFVEMENHPIYIPAVVGTLAMMGQHITQLQIDEINRRALAAKARA